MNRRVVTSGRCDPIEGEDVYIDDEHEQNDGDDRLSALVTCCPTDEAGRFSNCIENDPHWPGQRTRGRDRPLAQNVIRRRCIDIPTRDEEARQKGRVDETKIVD